MEEVVPGFTVKSIAVVFLIFIIYETQTHTAALFGTPSGICQVRLAPEVRDYLQDKTCQQELEPAEHTCTQQLYSG